MTMVIQVDACGEETDNNRALSALSLLLLLLLLFIIIIFLFIYDTRQYTNGINAHTVLSTKNTYRCSKLHSFYLEWI